MTPAEVLRSDLRRIAGLVPVGSRVLDLGCGDGSLLRLLRDERGCEVRGVELSMEGVAACTLAGIPVVQADLDEGLDMFDDASFDIVIVSQTLQVVRRPERILEELVRVGRRGIVSFPNFAHWRVRAYLALRGRMPVSASIPYSWYETPNIHHTTLVDFRDLADRSGLRIVEEIALVTSDHRPAREVRVLPNLIADTAVVVLAPSAAVSV